jgi:hypothetical protein
MRQHSNLAKDPAEKVVKDIRRATRKLDLALQASGLDCLPADQRPRLLSDNGPSYVAAELAD